MIGPDSEEIIYALANAFAPRKHVLLHRAAVRGEADVARLVDEGVSVDATLLPVEAYAEIKNIYEIKIEDVHLPRVNDAYPDVKQFSTGEDDVNELYPTGDCGEPETDIDMLFQTPLLRAANASVIESVNRLVDLGANKAFKSPNGATAISLAIAGCTDTEETAKIIRIVACPETVIPSPEVIAAEPGEELRFTWPLLAAAMNEACTTDTNVFEALVEAGCPVPPELVDEEAESWLSPDIVEFLRSNV